MARRAATAPAQVRIVEQGARAANLVTLEALARALGVPLSELFARESASASPPRGGRVFLRLVALLRDRGPEDLRAIEAVVRAIDRAADQKRAR